MALRSNVVWWWWYRQWGNMTSNIRVIYTKVIWSIFSPHYVVPPPFLNLLLICTSVHASPVIYPSAFCTPHKWKQAHEHVWLNPSLFTGVHPWCRGVIHARVLHSCFMQRHIPHASFLSVRHLCGSSCFTAPHHIHWLIKRSLWFKKTKQKKVCSFYDELFGINGFSHIPVYIVMLMYHSMIIVLRVCRCQRALACSRFPWWLQVCLFTSRS